MRTPKFVALAILIAPLAARANDWSEFRASATGSSNSAESSGAVFSPSWTYTAKHGGKLLSTPVSRDGTVVVAGTGGDLAAIGLHDGVERWSQSVEGGFGATPQISNGRVVVPSLDGQLYAFDVKSGALGWQKPFGGTNYASPVRVPSVAGVADSFVVAGGFPCQDVSRIDSATGAVTWTSAPLASLSYSSAAVVGRRAIVGMNGGRFQSLDLDTGAVGWKYDASGGMGNLSSALVDGGRVYMFPGDTNNQLYAVDLETGAVIPGFPLSIPDAAPVAGFGMLGRGPAVSSPMIAGGLVIVHFRRQTILDNPNSSFRVGMRELVAAIDPQTAKVVWQREIANVTAANSNGVPELYVVSTPAGFATADGPVVAVSSSISPFVAVLDAATGAQKWSAALSGPGRASPVFANGQLLVATDAGVLHAFSSTVNHAPSIPSELRAASALVEGQLAVSWNEASDQDGDLPAYRVRLVREDGLVTDTTTTPGTLTASLVVGGGTYHVSVRSVDVRGAHSAFTAELTVELPGAAATPVTPSDPVAGEPSTPPGEPIFTGMMPPPAPGFDMTPPPSVHHDMMPPSPVAADAPVPAAPPVVEPATSAAPQPASNEPAAAAQPTTPAVDASHEVAPAASSDEASEGVGCSMGGHAGGSSAASLFAIGLVLATLARRNRKSRPVRN